jgi:TonB family protein
MPESGSRPVWIAAAIVALVLHGGCIAFAITSGQFDDPDDALGAPAIAIDVDMLAPAREISELAPGPDSEASAAAPDVMQQQEIAKQVELPKDTPVETDDPDRVVTPDDSAKVVQEEPKPTTTQAVASTASVAAEDTAMPTLQAVKEAERTVAPVQGTGQSAERIRATWQKELIAHFNKYRRYPSDQPDRHVEIVVAFTLDRTGHVLSAEVEKSSGIPAFDAAAVAMVHRSDPVPAPPPAVADDTLTFSVPVNFGKKKNAP